nr:MAG TPA: hypothetical protein [Caudoviricetes sp.]
MICSYTLFLLYNTLHLWYDYFVDIILIIFKGGLSYE